MKAILIVLGLLFTMTSFGQVAGDSLKKQKYYDSSVNGIRLKDSESVQSVLGTKDNIIDNDDDETEVVNYRGSQLLTMISHPGDKMNQFSEFRIAYNLEDKEPKLSIRQKEFVTEKGVHLGITEEELINALGPPSEMKPGIDFLVYSYKQVDGLYFGKYWFKHGKLKQFWFGEEYP